MAKKGKLIVISGPPAAGKDTVMKELLNRDDLNLKKLVTYTSRPRRENETQGYDYHFVTLARFYELIYKQEMVEYELHGSDWKGANYRPFKEIIKDSASYIWRVTSYRGGTVKEFIQRTFEENESRKLLENHISIYVGPNDKQLLKQRYISRVQHPNIEEFEKRYLQDMRSYDRFKDRYDHILHNSGPLDETVEKAARLVKRI